MAPLQSSSVGWPGVQGTPTTPIVRRVIRLDVPVDKYPKVSSGVLVLCLDDFGLVDGSFLSIH